MQGEYMVGEIWEEKGQENEERRNSEARHPATQKAMEREEKET